MDMNGGIIRLDQLNREFEAYRPRFPVFQDNGDSLNLDPLLDSLLSMLGYLHTDQEMGCGDGPRQRPLRTAAPPSPSPTLSYDFDPEEEHRAGAEQALVEPDVEEASDESEWSERSLEVRHEPLEQSSPNGPCAAGRGFMEVSYQSLYDHIPAREEKRQHRFCRFFSNIFSKKSKSKPFPTRVSCRSRPWWRRIFCRTGQTNSYYPNN